MFSKILGKKNLLQHSKYIPLFLLCVLTFPLIAQAAVPDAPTSVTATAGNLTASVSWTVPDNRGSTITSYSVVSSPAAYSATTILTSVTATGLTNGTSYTFTVSADNAIGTSATSSASSAITPSVAPNGISASGGSASAPSQYKVPEKSTLPPTSSPVAKLMKSFITLDLSPTSKNDVNEVRKLQQFLSNHGTTKISNTGFFGPVTKNAIAAFQVANAEILLRPLVGNGYTEDIMKKGTGVLGPLTRTLMNLMMLKEALGIPN